MCDSCSSGNWRPDGLPGYDEWKTGGGNPGRDEYDENDREEEDNLPDESLESEDDGTE